MNHFIYFPPDKQEHFFSSHAGRWHRSRGQRWNLPGWLGAAVVGPCRRHMPHHHGQPRRGDQSEGVCGGRRHSYPNLFFSSEDFLPCVVYSAGLAIKLQGPAPPGRGVTWHDQLFYKYVGVFVIPVIPFVCLLTVFRFCLCSQTHYSVAETAVCQSVSQLEALQAVVECQQPEADLYR